MLIVQKFGGTSVGDLERIQNVASRVSSSKKDGHDIVVVVSAMSGETNKLVGYAEHFSKTPNGAEMDMLLSSGERVTASLLAIALTELGHNAVAMTGQKAGIVTDNHHTKARIEEINPQNMQNSLNEGKIVVVAGFQGVNAMGDVTTLGRGGSDLSAVAIAGALKADLCEIYTDVSGIYTTDPRIEPKAKKLDVNLVTRTSFSHEEGTLITKEENIMEAPLVSGIALDRNQARISLMGVKDRTGIASDIFNKLADSEVNVDMIIQNKAHDGATNIDFTVPVSDIQDAKIVVDSFVNNGEIQADSYNEEICKVSVVGVGMRSHTGVAAKAFSTMADNNININMISTSEIKISMVIDEKYAELAVRGLHDAYELDK